MERPQGCPSSQIIRLARSGPSLRRLAERGGAPKSSARGHRLGVVLAPFALQRQANAAQIVSRKFIALWGADTIIRSLNATHVGLANNWIQSLSNPFSKSHYATQSRAFFRLFAEEHGAPRLAQYVVRVPVPQPRNVTATNQEREAILREAAPFLRCWLLLCSDLAIRSGTALKLAPEHYDKAAGLLTFKTKYTSNQRLPVTGELAALLDGCRKQGVPFVAQLPRAGHWANGKPMKPLGRSRVSYTALQKAFRTLKQKLGVRAELRPHDLRRTTARNVYEITGDRRKVQHLLGHKHLASTLWYLQDALVQLPASTLELASLNPITEVTQ